MSMARPLSSALSASHSRFVCSSCRTHFPHSIPTDPQPVLLARALLSSRRFTSASAIQSAPLSSSGDKNHLLSYAALLPPRVHARSLQIAGQGIRHFASNAAAVSASFRAESAQGTSSTTTATTPPTSPPTLKPTSSTLPSASEIASAAKNNFIPNSSAQDDLKPPSSSKDGIILLPRAIEKLWQLAKSNNDGSDPMRLRIAIMPGGCHGFQYVFKLESADPSSQSPSTFSTSTTTSSSQNMESALSSFPPEEDVYFGSAEETGTPVVIDQASLDVVAGAKLDYSMDLIGNQFVIKDIPGSKSSCGCGTSFDVSM